VLLPPVLYTASVLRNFASAHLLDLCEFYCFIKKLQPRWTETEWRKTREHRDIHADICSDEVLKASWLGEPIPVSIADLAGVCRMRLALNGGEGWGYEDDGAAEVIYLAQSLKATVATDNPNAFDFVRNCLGEERAIDTLSILQDAVGARLIGPREAAGVIRSVVESGGRIRTRVPEQFDEMYFQRYVS
jgi:hypothetical protein